MAETGQAPDLDQLAAVLSQLLNAPVLPNILENHNAMRMLRETLCAPGGNGDAPQAQLSEDRRQALMNASAIGKAALKASAANGGTNTDADPQDASNPAWYRGGRTPSGSNTTGQYSERAAKVLATMPTPDGHRMAEARRQHLLTCGSAGARRR
jgi:hypothetical protein